MVFHFLWLSLLFWIINVLFFRILNIAKMKGDIIALAISLVE